MADQTATTPKPPQRGTGFPGLPLDEAAKVTKEAGQYGRAHSDVAFAGYLGHRTPNSGPFRSKMAALRDFGLIERPKDGQVPLTNLGHEIAHPTGNEQTLLRQAFFCVKPFATVYEESAKGKPLSLDLVANRAVTALGVSPASKDRFAESFRRSVVAAGLGRDGGDGMIELIPPDDEAAAIDAEDQEATPAPTLTTEGQTPQQPTGSAAAPAENAQRTKRPPIIHQEWPIAGGHVMVEVALDGPLPGSAFGEVGKVMTAVESLVASLEPDVPPDGGPSAAVPEDNGADVAE